MARMPGATWRPLSINHTKGGNRPRVVILHIIVGTLAGADSWFRNPRSKVSAHFGVGKTGTLYQWVDTADRAWANAGANSYSISIENEGDVGDALTEAQLNRCAEILAWAHRTHGVQVRVNNDVNGSGLSYHRMSSSWSLGGTACPGDRIIAQRGEIVRRAQALISGKPASKPVKEFLDVADLTWFSSSIHRKLPKGELVPVRWDNSHIKTVSKDNLYTSFVFEDKKFTGSFNGRLVGLDDDDNLIPVAYRIQLGKVDGAAPTNAAPKLLFPGGVFTTTECNMSLDEVTLKGERLRLYITALSDGLEWRYGKITGWTAKR